MAFVIKVLHDIGSLVYEHEGKCHIDSDTDGIVCSGYEWAGANSGIYSDSSEQKGQK